MIKFIVIFVGTAGMLATGAVAQSRGKVDPNTGNYVAVPDASSRDDPNCGGDNNNSNRVGNCTSVRVRPADD